MDNPYSAMRTHFQLNFDPRRSRIYLFSQDLFFNCLNREIILLEQKYKNGWYKILQIIEKDLFCILLETSFSRISSIFYSFLVIHDRGKSLQMTDIMSTILW